MKILINSLSARLGGGRTYLKNLLDYLPENLDLELLVYAPDSLLLPIDPRIRRIITKWPTTNPILRTFWEVILLPKILLMQKVDVLFCPGGVVATPVPSNCRVVTMFRNMIPFDPTTLKRFPLGLQKLRNLILKKVMLKSMANADLTIFISDYARKIIEKEIVLRNAVTIPHGINGIFRTQNKKPIRPHWLPKEEYILYVSRFDAYKHQLEVVIAYAGLPGELRSRYKLLLVGETDNTLARSVSEFIRHHNLENYIVITGPIDYASMPAVYHHANIILFASSCENCPNILLEALGAGRPVLSSSFMPMPEFGGDAVLYFNPTDPKSIRDQMIQVFDNELLRKELAAAAITRSIKFDWANTSRKTWQSILDLIAKKNLF